MEIWYNVKDETGVQLVSGKRYKYQIYTVFDGVRYNGSQKSFITNSIAPGNVTNLRAASAGKNSVKIYWNPVSGADGYLVYGQNGANSQYHYIGMTTSNSFLDKKARDTSYNFYWVYAYVKNDDGKMTISQCTKYVYARGILPSVKGLKASSVKGGVKLTWNTRGDADEYLIYGIRPGKKYGYIGMTQGGSFIDRKASKINYTFYWVYPYHQKGLSKIVGGTAPYTYGRAR